MTLTLDAGSARIFGGVLAEGRILSTFHKDTSKGLTEDELGLFLLQWLTAIKVDRAQIDAFVFCSVVPELNTVMERCSSKYFSLEALTLRAGVKSGLQVKYTNHQELGADLIANAVAAVKIHPGKDIIIVDFGTATSLCAVSAKGEYLGGTLIPGLDIAMEALAERTARLPVVEIQPVKKVCGRDAVSGIQGGLFFGTLGMLKELIRRMNRECFDGADSLVIATGAHADLYEPFGIFHQIVPELVLLGLEEIRRINLN